MNIKNEANHNGVKATKISSNKMSGLSDITERCVNVGGKAITPVLRRMLESRVGFRYGQRRYNMMRYANGERYCGGCAAYRVENPDRPNRCPECNQLLRRLPRRTIHKVLYQEVMQERLTEFESQQVKPTRQLTLEEVYGDNGWYEQHRHLEDQPPEIPMEIMVAP